MELYDIIWKQALPQLENSISTINYTNFIKKIEPIDIVGSKLILMTKNETQCNMIKTKILYTIKQTIVSMDYGITDVDIFVGSSKEEYETKKEEEIILPFAEKSPIDPKYTFDNFVVGQSNKYVYAAAKAVADDPGNSYNPLFIYGASGLGKTHILHSIANQLRITKPSLNVLYTPSEKFLNEFISSIHSGKSNYLGTTQFRNRYKNVDVLIIDDIQNLSKKTETQEVFFNIFNDLYGESKQIVLSADCDVNEIEVLSDRLRTRFDWGLKAQVTPPDLETKIAILQKKAADKKYILKLDVATFIAENSNDNVRSLEGLLNKVIFSAKLNESPITLDLAQSAIADNIRDKEQTKSENLDAEKILQTVCSYYNITKDDLLSKKRNKEIVEPRHICVYLMTELLSIPQEAIGQSIGRDHATVIHSRDKILKLIKVNEEVKNSVNELRNMLARK